MACDMNTSRQLLVCAAFAALLVLCLPSGADAAAGWMYSRPVTVPKVKPSGLPGSEVAVVTMPTGGLCKPDGSDILVQTALGKGVPFRILMMGPGDQARIAFALRGNVDNYLVLMGNPNPPPAPAPLDIQRGVLLETWEYVGGTAGNVDQAKQVLKRASTLLGRDFRPTVFLGHNPFGPQNRIVSVTTAWVIAKNTGSYKFAITSQDASFLLVDDTLVLSKPGWGPPHRDIRLNKAVDLTPGLHKITFYHVNANGDPMHTLGWQAPGDSRIWVIPKEAFAPVYQGVPGPIRKYASSQDVDFIPVHAGECFMDNHYLQRYHFEALKTGPGQVVWNWDFGDAQTSTVAQAEHVYLVPGVYTVKLTGRTSAGTLERTNRIVVSRPWDKVADQAQDSLETHGAIVAGYDFSKLQVEAAGYAVEMFKRLKKPASVVAVVDALLTKDAAPPEVLRRAIAEYCDVLIAQGEFDKAVKGCQKAATMTKDPGAAADVLMRAGQVCLLDAKKVDQAQQIFDAVLKKYGALTTNPAIRSARIGQGDVWRARGDYDKAAKAYETAGEGEEVTRGREPIIRGDFARHVETYIAAGDLESAQEYLSRWEDAFPRDKLVGYWSLMQVRYLLACKKPAEAIAEAETLARVNPASNYGAELLMLAAGQYKAQSKLQQYRQTLQQIVEKFPESPLSLEAAKLLKP
ncbi:MAG: PA14 domain protein [Planctomycetes bacterium ADurb.Bin126]|nr:MAG: PA14 domain protein [Planctomycetes bacterium ADurb.Bin126]